MTMAKDCTTALSGFLRDRLFPPVPARQFRRSVFTLAYLGQLPVALFTVVLILLLGSSAPLPAAAIVAFVAAIIALFPTFFALHKSPDSQAIPTLLLSVAMLITFVQVHCLIGITGATRSPLAHLYLYMPAVVLMVTLRKRWAEVLCGIGCLLSHYVNNRLPFDWNAWQAFAQSRGYYWFQLGVVAFFLFFLFQVNRRMEREDV